MIRVLDLTVKDLLQIVRDWKAAFFLVIMPIVFTLLFGFVFGGSGGEEDPRLPVGVLNLDNVGREAQGARLGDYLITLLQTSDVIRPVLDEKADAVSLAKHVADGELVAVLVIPEGYSEAMLVNTSSAQVQLIADAHDNVGHTAQVSVNAAVNRLLSAIQAANLSVWALSTADPAQYNTASARQVAFDNALAHAVEGWQDPPFMLAKTKTGQEKTNDDVNPYAHSSAGMMAQFAIAGLIGAAEVVVVERKSRTLQRLLTTAISKAQVIAGHFLAMFVMILLQLMVLTVFAHLILGVNYWRAPLATLLMVFAFAFFAGALGMLIAALAKTEEQVIIFSLVPMFVLSGLGGAWMPLEFTGEGFQAVAHFTPVAWAMDGFNHIIVRGLGLASVLAPAGMLLGFGVFCLVLSVWLFRVA
jgi:ABC-2 type transport system permease protein